jgi:hypothetical protein
MNQKNRIISPGWLFILLLSAGSCVTPVTPKLNPNDSKPLLVVEGQITDQEGPFRVKLAKTVQVSDTANAKTVLNADVRIFDDQGHSYQLSGNGNGTYETADKNLKGIPGNTYTLIVTTPDDGYQYTSMPVLMREPPAIDSVYFEEVKHTRITQGVPYEDTWLNILVDTHDASGKTKYWRWENLETWEVNLTADPVKVYTTPGEYKNFWWGRVTPIDDKKLCWATRPAASIVVASTVNNSVDELKGFIVQSIGPGEAKLHIRYSILVKQYALDEDLYNYWKLLKDVNENSGGMYNKIPGPVFGNITCCDGTGKVLGFFSASSLKEKRIFINRSEHHLETNNVNAGCTYFNYGVSQYQQRIFFGNDVSLRGPIYTSSKECADCTQYATNVKPSFW